MTPLRHSAAALLAALALPVGALALAVRPDWREGIGERLGARKTGPQGAIWLHAASLGEAAVMARLVPALRARGHPLCASFTTLSGRSRMQQLAPDLRCELAPIDHPWSVNRVLSSLQPAALILVETELWPCLIAGAHRHGVPIALVSARLSDESFQRYRSLRWGFAPSLGRIDCIGARSAEDAERFISLGAHPDRVKVTGDLKWESLVTEERLSPDLAHVLGECPLIVAGSTHAGEEEAALLGLAACESAGLVAALVLAPRHLDRCQEIEDLVSRHGRRLIRRTGLPSEPLGSGDVLLLDTTGELSRVYTRARLAFVGGSLVPRGGHNLLEPVQAGVPVCFGPHLENVHRSAALLISSGAGRKLVDGRALAAWAVEVLKRGPSHPSAEAGRELVRANRGSLAKTLALLSSLIEKRTP